MTLKSELEAKAFIDGDIEGWDKVVRLSDVLAIVEEQERILEKFRKLAADATIVRDEAKTYFELYAFTDTPLDICKKADLLDALCEMILKVESIRFARGGEYVWTTIENQMDSEEFETPLAAIENLVETFKKEKE